jgi:hypothetical protein
MEWQQDEMEDVLFLAHEWKIKWLVEHAGSELAKEVSDKTFPHLLQIAEVTECEGMINHFGFCFDLMMLFFHYQC